MLLRLRVAIACPVDELVDHVMKPQQIGEGLVALKVIPGRIKEMKQTSYNVSKENLLNTIAHQSIDVKLIVAGGLKQFLVTCQIIVQNSAVINHATQGIIDYRGLDSVRQQFYDFSIHTELSKLVGRRRDENVSPMQVTMLKLEFSFSHCESQCGL